MDFFVLFCVKISVKQMQEFRLWCSAFFFSFLFFSFSTALKEASVNNKHLCVRRVGRRPLTLAPEHSNPDFKEIGV